MNEKIGTETTVLKIARVLNRVRRKSKNQLALRASCYSIVLARSSEAVARN